MVEVKLLGVIATGDLPEHEEIALADGFGELLHGAAEVSPLLAAHVLQGIDPQAIASVRAIQYW